MRKIKMISGLPKQVRVKENGHGTGSSWRGIEKSRLNREYNTKSGQFVLQCPRAMNEKLNFTIYETIVEGNFRTVQKNRMR